MAIPPEILNLINRIQQELEQIDEEATRGVNIVRQLMLLFSDSIILLNFFAYLNDVIIFVEISKRRIQNNLALLSSINVPSEVIQEVGEDLGNLLGRVLETKIEVQQIRKRIQELQ